MDIEERKNKELDKAANIKECLRSSSLISTVVMFLVSGEMQLDFSGSICCIKILEHFFWKGPYRSPSPMVLDWLTRLGEYKG